MVSCESGLAEAVAAIPARSETGVRMKNSERSGWGESTEHPATIAHAPNAMSKAVAFLTVPAVSALGWLFYFVIIYGAPDPTAPFGDTQNSFAALPNGLGGLLFDQGFGLLATAPVFVFAIAGFARAKRLALEWSVVSAPYLLAIGTYPLWWAGTSGPARFLVPLLLPLAIPAACAWKAFSRGVRTALFALLGSWLMDAGTRSGSNALEPS